MRHPDAAQIRERCAEQVPEILRRVGHPSSRIDEDREGWVNVCFLTDEVVVRFNARDPHLPKFRREEECYRRLRDAGFPVPEVLARFDADVWGVPVLVTERLPGENLEQTWGELDDSRREDLAFQAGRWLARLHRIEFDAFGEPFAPEFSTWAACFDDIAGRFLGDCEDLDIFTGSDAARFAKALESGRRQLPEIQPRLVHRDYHLGNLLHDGDQITGILDFEWSLVGDPVWDLTGVDSMDETWPGSSGPFREGYEAEAPWPEFGLRGPLYQCLRNLELCAVAERFLTDREAVEYAETTLGQLAMFEEALA